MEVFAQPIVSSVLESLRGWLKKEANLPFNVRSQVGELEDELRRMSCFLVDADAMEKEGDSVQNWVLEIRELSYDAEDVVETFVLTIESRRRGGGMKNYVKRFACIFKEGMDRRDVRLEIEAIKRRLYSLKTSLQAFGISSRIRGAEGCSSSSAESRGQLEPRRSYSYVVEKDLVGLVDDVRTLVELLVNDEYHTVSICGMGGLGKTTLAQRVYSHPNVRRYFDGFAWVYGSQQVQKAGVLLGILIKLIPEERKKIVEMREEELVKKLHQVLQEKKYLVVIDDIWSETAWDGLRPGIPVGDMPGKILLTTRNKEVASYVDPHGFLHEPRLLTEDEGWELLRKKALSSTGNIYHPPSASCR